MRVGIDTWDVQDCAKWRTIVWLKTNPTVYETPPGDETCDEVLAQNNDLKCSTNEATY